MYRKKIKFIEYNNHGFYCAWDMNSQHFFEINGKRINKNRPFIVLFDETRLKDNKVEEEVAEPRINLFDEVDD